MKKLSEQSIIRFLAHEISLPQQVHGIGDDAAVIERHGECDVITKDLLIEDQHFRLRYYTPQQLAKKALHVNLSDIAAMGATPRYIFLGLGIPQSLSPDWLTEFLHHFKIACQHANVYLLGGDTTHSPNGLFISITAIGQASPTHIKYRSGAVRSDIICLLGYAGDSHAGLLLLERNIADFDALKACTLSPSALIAEGLWLSKQSSVTAMLDTSDGIYIDLKKLCDASKVGAVLHINALPLSPLLPSACEALHISPIECALIGGEDYGLLFTVKKEAYDALSTAFQKEFNTPLTAIGEITDSNHLELMQHDAPYAFHYKPFSHFDEEI